MLYEQIMQEIYASYENRFQNAAQPDLHAGTMIPNVEEKLAHVPFLFFKPIHQWMNLDIDFYPPSSHWQEHEIKVLCRAFRQLFEAYNYIAVMPWDMELSLEYDCWLIMLRKPATCYLSISEGSSLEYVEICDGERSTCPFGDCCLKEDDEHCSQSNMTEHWYRYL